MKISPCIGYSTPVTLARSAKVLPYSDFQDRAVKIFMGREVARSAKDFLYSDFQAMAVKVFIGRLS